MRKLFLSALFAMILGLPSLNLMAEEAIHVTQTTISIPKKVLVEQNMRLTDAESASFWVVYDEYELALDKINQRMEELIKFYAQNQRTLTDADAKSMVDQYLTIEKDKIAIRTDYVSKFESVLSARQVARLYQIENKIEAITRFGLAEAIPLVDAMNHPQEPGVEQ